MLYFCQEEETEEDIACQELERKLAEKGVNVSAATLQRALYPPSGRTKYYQISADLPRKPSLTLLSHPKTWLPEEYKQLQRAEKNLGRLTVLAYSTLQVLLSHMLCVSIGSYKPHSWETELNASVKVSAKT
ncbi:hypothetical protein DPMN_179621 [Dreissena polymorpha]|uniref:Uncharacterized protein n=1 Tax=Dreissena polymorpha TaxID=45954 RepID=A0A9D4EF39_DREPO|nr:hypothetical protein DPMN_179621 [Dreissena polymorpha]